jgi:(p)ppGpp synthase/HD superfamily hydrolase
MWDDKVINKALFFSVRAHRNQRMKFQGDIPYYAHVFGVLLTVVNYVDDSSLDWNFLAQVALLHDTIEDTDVKYNDILGVFGREVADAVFALTKNPILPRSMQMKECINKILLQPREVAIVKLADRCFNVRERVSSWTKEKQKDYVDEAQLICDKLGGASTALRQKLQQNIDALRNE